MEDDKKITKKLDRLIMGVILGGAIGSVLGLTLAPRKGKETREILKKKGQQLYEKGKEASGKFVRDHQETFRGAKYQWKKGKGFLKWLFRRKKTDIPMPRATLESKENRDTQKR